MDEAEKMSDVEESKPLCEGLKKDKDLCPLCWGLNVRSLKILPLEEERGNKDVPQRDVGEMT